MTTIRTKIAAWVESDYGSCPVSGTALLAFLDSQQAEIDRLRAELEKPVEQSYTATQLAAMVLSDCGISTNHTALHERVAARITRHEDELIDRLKNQAKPPAPAWHDAPTEPGLWLCFENGYAYAYPEEWDKGFAYGEDSRWYGPISPDTGNKS